MTRLACRYRQLPPFLVLVLALMLPTGAWPVDEPVLAVPTDDDTFENPPPPAPASRSPSPPSPSQSGASRVPKIKLGKGEVLLNFQAADIQAVVKAISQMTNRNFLIDPRVKGTITIISAKPVTRATAYQVFLSALKAQGFTATEGPGGLVRIIPTAEAKTSATVYADGPPPNAEQMSTHIIIAQHISAAQMVPLLRPLMAPTSQLSAYDAANALIITDYADNIRRMLRIIEKIDQPISTDVTVIPLKHASALDMSDLITRLATSAAVTSGAPPQQGSSGDRFNIVPDLRTNSLLVRSDNPGRLDQLRSLIDKLDVPATTEGTTRVVYLRNAEATKMAEVLRGLLAGEARSATAASAVAIPGGAGGRVPGPRAIEASLIQADEATNALIINASDAVYNNLRAVIEKLDVRRAQVFVEALIAEVTSDKANQLGFQWADVGRAGSGAIGGIQNFPSANPSLGAAIANPLSLAGASGLTVAFLGPEITLPDGSRVRSLGALARALEQQNLGNILSTPNLMTLDNAEAKIVVAQNVPFLTGSFTSTGGTTPTANPFQTIERRDVGITLKIKPQISEGGVVRLEIAQEISSVAAGVETTELNRITNKRSLDTQVAVDDGNTVVLGGLIQDSVEETRQQVPILGRIPLLGALFRYKENVKKKTNLMVFLRPTIIRTVDDSFRATTDRYDYIRAQNKETDKARVEIIERFTPRAPEPKPIPQTPPAGNGTATEAAPNS